MAADNYLFDCLNVSVGMRTVSALRRALCRFVRVNYTLWHREFGGPIAEFIAYVNRVQDGLEQPRWWFIAAAVLRYDIRVTVRDTSVLIMYSSARSRVANYHKPILKLEMGHDNKYKLQRR